jgi:hypothetical protein
MISGQHFAGLPGEWGSRGLRAVRTREGRLRALAA